MYWSILQPFPPSWHGGEIAWLTHNSLLWQLQNELLYCMFSQQFSVEGFVKKIVSIELCIKLVPGISLSFTYKKCTKSIFFNVILQLCVKNCSHFATTNMLLLCENLKTPSFFSVTNQYEWKMHDKNINVCKTVHTCSHGIAVKVNTMAMLGPANKSLYGS